MPSYLVTGASQGLGFAFLQNLAKNPSNVVFGIARKPAPLEARLKAEGFENVYVIEGDVGDFESIEKAAQQVAKITGGSLDILINNAGLVSKVAEFKNISDFPGDSFQTLIDDFNASFKVNAVGLVNTVQSFLPLIRKGSIKKVANISTAMADVDVINKVGIEGSGPYSASKAAANVIIAKYSAAHKSEGILFLSISPGYVATERNNEAASNDPESAMAMGKKFAEWAPHFTGPLTPEQSIDAVLTVIDEKSVENGDGGSFISHWGNKEWL